MWWNNIIAWFSERRERKACVKEFNSAAREAFVQGYVPVYMKAEISRGNSNYKHGMSNLLFSGFRIRTLSGRLLSPREVENVGLAITTNSELMRRLATLGFDTLEVYSPEGILIKDWRITQIMQIA